jgi:hypothetical protein
MQPVTKAETRIAQIHLNARGSLTREPEKSPPPSEPVPTPAAWSLAQILAWIISRGSTNVLAPEMLPKREWAEKELTKKLTKELNKMLARSVEIERAALEGRTPPSLCDDDSVFCISGFRSGALAHLLRIGYLTQEDIQWDDISGSPEGIKWLWPAFEAEAAPAPAADAAPKPIEPATTEPAPAEPPAGLPARGGEPSPAQCAFEVQSETPPPATQPNKQTVANLAPGNSKLAAAKKQMKRQVKKQVAKKQVKRQAKKQATRRGPDRYSKSDRALFRAITELIKKEQLSAQEAAQRLSDLGKIEGRGSANSRKLRLARRYREEVQKR